MLAGDGDNALGAPFLSFQKMKARICSCMHSWSCEAAFWLKLLFREERTCIGVPLNEL